MSRAVGTEGSKSGPVTPARLPAVDRLVGLTACADLVTRHGRSFVTAEARALLAELRQTLRAGEIPDLALDDASLATALEARCAQRLAPRMRAVINMTGTVLHTNLGRAVLAEAAIQRVVEAMAAPAALEYDIERGTRGDRDAIVEGLLCELTGAEAATVVNNNAAAVLLTLAALAGGREAIVSRGEQVEIGGSFRLPDVMASAGARMVEVGTTNRTHLADYERAIGPDTALLFKVHTSNYAVQGFTASVPERELAVLARARGVPLATDLGSGSLIDLARYGLPKEPTPAEMIAAGCDVVTFSGDKLLGGPQAGLIVGTRAAIDRIRRFPMKRALRVSKLPLAALEATLMLYLQPERLVRDLPALRWMTRPADEIAVIAQALSGPLADALAPAYQVTVAEMLSQIGSGSLPVDRLPSCGLAIEPILRGRRGSGAALETLATALRGLPVPVIGRIQEDRLLLDCRCMDDPHGLLSQLDTLKARLPAA